MIKKIIYMKDIYQLFEKAYLNNSLKTHFFNSMFSKTDINADINFILDLYIIAPCFLFQIKQA